LASLPDAEALAAVEHASLGDSAYIPAEMLAILARAEQYVYLACEAGQVVGFLACLETEGGRRLEVDMLGVLPDWRGRGIARALVAQALEAARGRAVRRTQAVVAVDNIASRRVMERAGLTARSEAGAPRVYGMLVYDCQGYAPQPLPAGWTLTLEPSLTGERLRLSRAGSVQGQAVLLQVQTLSYHGLWIESVQAEGAPAQQALARAAAERAKHLRVDQAGFLAPQPAGSPAPRRAPRCLSWIREGYRDMGDYIVYEGNLR